MPVPAGRHLGRQRLDHPQLPRVQRRGARRPRRPLLLGQRGPGVVPDAAVGAARLPDRLRRRGRERRLVSVKSSPGARTSASGRRTTGTRSTAATRSN
jgi:hypothetical protein